MENISQLRKLCQGQMKDVDTWQDKLICRRFSIYLTWLLLHADIRAMQVTWFFLIFGIIPGVLFYQGYYLWGALALQLWQKGRGKVNITSEPP